MAGSRGRPSLASPDAPPAGALPQLYERTVPGGRCVAWTRALRDCLAPRLDGFTGGCRADKRSASASTSERRRPCKRSRSEWRPAVAGGGQRCAPYAHYGGRLCWRRAVTRGCRAHKRSACASGSGRRRAPSGAVAVASLKERRHPRLGGGCAALIRPTRTAVVGFAGGAASLVVVGRISAAHAPAPPKDAARADAAGVSGALLGPEPISVVRPTRTTVVGFVGGAASLVVVGRISAAHAPAPPKEAARPNAAGMEQAASLSEPQAGVLRTRDPSPPHRPIARTSKHPPHLRPRKAHATNRRVTAGRRSPVASALHSEHHRYGPERLITDAKEETTCLNP